MTKHSYRWAIQYSKQDGQPLGAIAVSPDWAPAREWARLEGIRAGSLPAVTGLPTADVEPVWDRESGPPYVESLRVRMATARGDTLLSSEIPVRYLESLARARSSRWVEEKSLAVGELFRHRVCAYRCDSEPRSHTDRADELTVEELARPLPLQAGALESFLEGSEPCGAIEPADLPVFVPEQVIEEACAIAARSEDCEAGGVLVGALRRSPARSELFVEVTAQIPARHTAAQRTSFTFTPDIWSAAETALRLRARGEQTMGWWHSHPFFCRGCPDERRRLCAWSSPCFSGTDVHLYRSCFPSAYQVALLISLLDGGPVPALFGWQRGLVAERGYHLLHSPSEGR